MWEYQVMVYLDKNSHVVKWGSEEAIIPYVSPIDGRVHRYFPDFIATIKTNEGAKVVLMEVKPLKDTQLPDPKKPKTATWQNQLKTYVINSAKFEAAKQFCQKNGFEWMIITERELESLKHGKGI